jgi:hypothetical protein
VDSKDFRTRDPGTVQRKVMADLARAKKGIILFHDIQSSTARALPGLLTELKAKGYRIVHMQPKAEATTVAEYDDQARQELDRRRVKVADQPLAKRSLTWPVAAASRLPVEPVAIKASATARPPPARQGVRPAAASKQGQDWAANFLVSRQMNP